jgi:hypothetical protein
MAIASAGIPDDRRGGMAGNVDEKDVETFTRVGGSRTYTIIRISHGYQNIPLGLYAPIRPDAQPIENQEAI